ncbi:MAG: terminase TerL endonuclease subunit, partial [Parvibaculaceae bacterium]
LDDESCWPKANPSLHVVLQPDYIRTQVADAKAIPGNLNETLRLNFCVWTDAVTAWMARPTIEAVLADFDPYTLHKGKTVYFGLDLSATRDLTVKAGVVETGTDAVGRPTYDAWIEAWTPADTLRERALQDKAPYDVWVREGHLFATPGKTIGFEFVAAQFEQDAINFEIGALAYDRYGFKAHFEPHLDALGLDFEIVEHPQGGKKKGAASGLWMPGSKLILETLILEKRIRIRRNPVLISACMSAAVEGDPYGNFWFSKRKASNRIDALVALATGVGCATMPRETEGYDLDLYLANPVVVR